MPSVRAALLALALAAAAATAAQAAAPFKIVPSLAFGEAAFCGKAFAVLRRCGVDAAASGERCCRLLRAFQAQGCAW